MNRWEKALEAAETHDCEAYIISNPVNIRYLSSYRGEASLLLLSSYGIELFTDFRCLEDAEREAIGECKVYEVPDNFTLLDYVLEHIKRRSIKKVAFESKYISYETYERIRSAFECYPIPNGIEKLRMIKDESEIDSIRKAGEIVSQGYRWIIENLRPGVSERFMEIQLEAFLKTVGAEDRAFPFIIAAGENAAKPHARPSNRLILKGDPVVFDFGVVYNGYHIDVTRTFFIGEVSSKVMEVYKRVRDAQERVLEEVKPGVKVKELCEKAISLLGEWAQFFKHSLGHGVGLEIHEAPRLSKSSEDFLEEGMVITIEPGVYLRGSFGIRIEDTVVVRSGGVEILTPLSKEGILCL